MGDDDEENPHRIPYEPFTPVPDRSVFRKRRRKAKKVKRAKARRVKRGKK